MAMLYLPTGRTKQVKPQGEAFTNEEIQELLGGYFERTRTVDGQMMLVDDEGKLKGLEPNIPATRLYIYGRKDVIVGPALVLEDGEME